MAGRHLTGQLGCSMGRRRRRPWGGKVTGVTPRNMQPAWPASVDPSSCHSRMMLFFQFPSSQTSSCRVPSLSNSSPCWVGDSAWSLQEEPTLPPPSLSAPPPSRPHSQSGDVMRLPVSVSPPRNGSPEDSDCEIYLCSAGAWSSRGAHGHLINVTCIKAIRSNCNSS